MAEQKFRFLSDAQELVLPQLERAAQDEVDQKYGIGHPTQEGCGGRWFYHNGCHTCQVRDDYEKMSRAMGLSRGVQLLGRFAAAEHDNNQGPGHEKTNASRALERLRSQGFSKYQRKMVRLAIRGTEVEMQASVLVGQKATSQEYPTEEAEKMALSLACADLGVLWTPQGPLQMHNLYREIRRQETPLVDADFGGFLRSQRQTLDVYRYPLQEAWDVLATHYDQVMAYHDHVLEQVDRSELTWAQLDQQDQEFARNPDEWYAKGV